MPNTSADIGGIAVVIPSYNRGHLIIYALESVLHQTLPPDQVILVDDGSTDDTHSVITEWQKSKTPAFELRYIPQLNSGPGAARNRGIREAANCNWIALLDSDDLWPSNHLSTLAAAVEENPDAVAASNELEEKFYSDDGSLLSSRRFLFARELVAGEVIGPGAFRLTGPLTPASMIRRDALLAAGGFDTRLRYAEDKLLFMIISTMGPWCRVPR